MRLKFNVLHEPWIPMANGERHSLLSALENAAALPGVLCASPLETCAVYRLMIAFAMDALHLQDRDERTALLKRGAFDMQPFREYIERCESEGASLISSTRGGPSCSRRMTRRWMGRKVSNRQRISFLKYRKGTIIYSFVTVPK